MYKDLLAGTKLLELPIVAMFLFLAVFLAVIVRAAIGKREEISALETLPLAEDGAGR